MFQTNELTQQAARQAFEHEASAVLARLREALLAVLASLPASSVRTSADLERLLGIGATPAWQVVRIARATHPLAAGLHVPGPAPMGRFLGALAKQGVPPRLVEAAEEAYRAFERLVGTHAGDRRTFDSLVSGYATSSTGAVATRHKRAAFRGNSHLWGAQAKTVVRCALVNRSAELPETHFDACNLHGFVSLRRLRSTVPLIVSCTRRSDEPIYRDLVKMERFRRAPLLAEDELTRGVPLLRDFCSQPPPEVRIERSPSGDLQTELVASGVGNESAITYMEAYVQRNLPGPYLDASEPVMTHLSWIRIPSQVLVRDLLLHRDFGRPVWSEVRVYGDRSRSSPAAPHAFTETDRLCVEESVVHLGTGTGVLHTAEVPRYVEMVEYALERMGWSPAEFEVYRCRVEYPIVQSVVSVILRFETRPDAR